LFILGGSFVGLEEQVKKRTVTGSSIGFGATLLGKKENINHWLDNVEPEDFVKFGMIPEFMGRVPIIAALEELSANDLIKVMTEPEDSIEREYQQIFKLDNVELEFNPGARSAIAQLSIAKKTGARGLRSIIEHLLLELQFNLPELAKEGLNKVIITEKSVNDRSPVLIYKSKEEVA